MHILRRSLAIVGGLSILTLSFTLTSAGQAVAQGMKPLLVHVINTAETAVPVTVVGSHEPVQLALSFEDDTECSGGTRPVRRILPDGSIVAPFSVPEGKVLVLTDLDGVIDEDVPWTVGHIANLSVSATGFTSALLRASTPITADAVSSRILSMSTHLQSGALIGAGNAICVSASAIQPGGFAIAGVVRSDMRGYLIPEQVQ